jgi:hypothetical protein
MYCIYTNNSSSSTVSPLPRPACVLRGLIPVQLMLATLLRSADGTGDISKAAPGGAKKHQLIFGSVFGCLQSNRESRRKDVSWVDEAHLANE